MAISQKLAKYIGSDRIRLENVSPGNGCELHFFFFGFE